MPESPRYCRACRYPLAGLPENRCPECGTPFDPADPRTYRTSLRRVSWVSIAAALASPWLVLAVVWAEAALFGRYEVVLVLLGVGLLGALWRQRWKSAVWLLALSPFVVMPVVGGARYFTGAVELRWTAVPNEWDPRKGWVCAVDPVYRCARYEYSGLRPVFSPIVHGIPEATAKFMIRQLGPPRGAYRGLFPTTAEVLALSERAEPVDPVELWNGRVTVDGRTIQVRTAECRNLLLGWPTYWAADDDGSSAEAVLRKTQSLGPPIAAVTCNQQCLILRISGAYPEEAEQTGWRNFYVLFDIQTGKAFAYYAPDPAERRIFLTPWRK